MNQFARYKSFFWGEGVATSVALILGVTQLSEKKRIVFIEHTPDKKWNRRHIAFIAIFLLVIFAYFISNTFLVLFHYIVHVFLNGFCLVIIPVMNTKLLCQICLPLTFTAGLRCNSFCEESYTKGGWGLCRI